MPRNGAASERGVYDKSTNVKEVSSASDSGAGLR